MNPFDSLPDMTKYHIREASLDGKKWYVIQRRAIPSNITSYYSSANLGQTLMFFYMGRFHGAD